MKKVDILCLKNLINKILKILFILFFVFSLFSFYSRSVFSVNVNFCSADSEGKKYAKAKENCFLFKTTDITSSSFSNVFFVVPESYFVVILNEVNPSVLKVDYLGKIGYVAVDSVEKATFIPVCPTLDDITFDIVQNVGTQLRSSPTVLQSNILTIVPAGESEICYVSYINGNKPDGGNSDVWYYVKYIPTSDPTSVYEGYIYSEKTCNLSPIALNKENNPKIENEDNDGLDEDSISMSPKVRIILIVLISLPIVLVFILLVVNNHKSIDKSKKNDTLKSEQKTDEKPKLKARDFAGKRFVKKSPDEYMFVSNDRKSDVIKPSFPTYEVVDDDDLL